MMLRNANCFQWLVLIPGPSLFSSELKEVFWLIRSGSLHECGQSAWWFISCDAQSWLSPFQTLVVTSLIKKSLLAPEEFIKFCNLTFVIPVMVLTELQNIRENPAAQLYLVSLTHVPCPLLFCRNRSKVVTTLISISACFVSHSWSWQWFTPTPSHRIVNLFVVKSGQG